jgi:hypothetical protein
MQLNARFDTQGRTKVWLAYSALVSSNLYAFALPAAALRLLLGGAVRDIENPQNNPFLSPPQQYNTH